MKNLQPDRTLVWLCMAFCIWVAPTILADIKIALSSTIDPKTSGTYVWAKAFSDELAKNGVRSEIFASSSLGNEVVRAEQVLLGLLEVNVCGTQEVDPFSDMIAALELPFIFEGSEEIDRLMLETDFLQKVNEDSAPHGMRVVDVVFMGGKSGLFTARNPIRELGDVKSFRMRAMMSEQIRYFEAWGGMATQVAWEEVPQALQTGIVDGYMNPPIVAVLFGHGGQLDYFTDIQMTPSVRVVSVSEAWYQSLDRQERVVLEQAIIAARKANREWVGFSEQREFQLLADIGIEVIKISSFSRNEFRQKLLPLYDRQASPETLKSIKTYLHGLRKDL